MRKQTTNTLPRVDSLMERVQEEDNESMMASEYDPSVVSDGMNARLLSLDAKLIKTNRVEETKGPDYFDDQASFEMQEDNKTLGSLNKSHEYMPPSNK